MNWSEEICAVIFRVDLNESKYISNCWMDIGNGALVKKVTEALL